MLKVLVRYDNTAFEKAPLINCPMGYLVGVNPLNGDVYVATGEYKNDKNWYDCCQIVPNSCAFFDEDFDHRLIPEINDLWAACLYVRDHFDKSFVDEARKLRNAWLKEMWPEQYYKYFPKERPNGA